MDTLRMTDQGCNVPAIAADAVSFRYRVAQGERAWTVEQVTFEVAPGEIVGIVGPNGSGKSSLLKLLAGLLPTASGTIRLNGQLLDQLPPTLIALTLAMVPQEHDQLFPFTVAETVLMGRFPHRKSGWWNLGPGSETQTDYTAAHRAMSETSVAHLADRLVADLSGGERQRVMIARALAQEPRILLLDEPTAFLDLHHQIETAQLIEQLRRERGLTVILVSHDLNMAGLLCDRLLMLKDGRVLRSGPPSETIHPDIVRAIYNCDVVIDTHPQAGVPRVTMPSMFHSR
ncbi:MAG: ABC transporter ATP-binding protein [Nitrospira sp.]